MKNKLKANGYRIIKLVLVCCALLAFSVMGIATVLPQINATSQITLDTPIPLTATPIPPTATPIPTAVPTTPPPPPTATPIPPTAVPTTPPPPPTTVPTKVPATPRPTTIPTKVPTAIPAPPATATSIASQTATAVASATPTATTPTATVGAISSPTVIAKQQAVTAPTSNTPPPGNGGGNSNIVLPAIIAIVMLLIAGSLGGLVLLRKRGIPAFSLAALGSSRPASPSIPWTRNKKIGPSPTPDSGSAPLLQAGAFAANGQAWAAPNNGQNMAGGAFPPSFAANASMLAQNSPILPISNQPYTPSALRPITTSLPAEYPNARPLNTIQTSDMRPLSMDLANFSKVFNQQTNLDTLHQASPQLAPSAYSGVATQQLARPITASIPVPPPNTPATTGKLTPRPVAAPSQIPAPSATRPVTPLPPTTPLLTESQLTGDPMLETIMRQAQMGLYVLPDKQAPNPTDNKH